MIAPDPIPLADRAEPAEPVFDRDIFPILESKCMTCHDREGGLAEGDLDLTSVDSLVRGGKHGPSLQTGKGEESLIFQRSSHRLKPIMPPEGEGDPLTSEEITLLKRWIDQGIKPGEQPAPSRSRSKSLAWERVSPAVAPVLGLACSPDGSLLAVAQGTSVFVVDPNDGKVVQSFASPQDLVQSLAWSADGTRLAAGVHGEVLLWTRAADGSWSEPASIKPLLERAVAIAFSPDGRQLAVGAGVPSARGELTLWSTDKQELVRQWTDPHSDLVTGVAFSPDGTLLATSSADKFVKVWNVGDGGLVKSFEGHTGSVLGVSWNADGKQIASAGADSAIKLWSMESGEQVLSITDHRQEVTSVRFLPGKGEIFATCGDRLGRLWNAGDGKLIRLLEGGGDFLLAGTVSLDGKRLFAGSYSGDVYLWNTEDGKLIQTIRPPALTASRP